MSWFVYQITDLKLLLGVVAAIGSAPMMLSSIWAAADERIRTRLILIATQTAQMACAVLPRSRRLGGFRHAIFHYRHGCIERRRHGLRYASAPVVHSRNDKP